jgi:hypothetical protein
MMCAVVCPRLETASNICPEHGKPDCCGDSNSDKHPCSECIDTHFAPQLKSAVMPAFTVTAYIQPLIERAVFAHSFFSDTASTELQRPSETIILRI